MCCMTSAAVGSSATGAGSAGVIVSLPSLPSSAGAVVVALEFAVVTLEFAVVTLEFAVVTLEFAVVTLEFAVVTIPVGCSAGRLAILSGGSLSSFFNQHA